MSDQLTDLAEIANLYVRFMEEIKRRIDVIRRVSDGQIAIPRMVAFEICYLQLRKICEVFALACLAAHGDIPEVRRNLLRGTYRADQIIKQLTRLHPNFYPVPGTQQLDPVTGQAKEVVPVTYGFLTKGDLLRLYGDCGNYLHRGSLRQLLTTWEPAPDFTRIHSAVAAIVELLNHHQIQLPQPDKQLWVLMQSKKDGRVRSFVMQRVGEKTGQESPPQPQH